MATQVRAGQFRFADFLELVHEDQKADLLDGVIYMASPESLDHNALVSWMDRVLGTYVERRRLGRVTVNKVAYRLSHENAPEPDIAFVSTARLGVLKHGYVDGPPDVAVEFVSPESVDRDYELKRRRYEEFGVREYWIIDPDERRATFLTRVGNSFEAVETKDGIFRSGAIAGFEFQVDWLWMRPLPETYSIVTDLLGKTQP